MSLETDFDHELLDDYYIDEQYYEESFSEVWNNCVILSILGIVPSFLKIIGVNLVFGCLNGYLSENYLHLISGCFGIFLLSSLEHLTGKLFILFFWIISFLILQLIIRKHIKNAQIYKIVFMISLVFCEYYLIDRNVWLEIRGIIMILVMKIISLVDDYQQLNIPMNFLQYFGYSFCSANILLGPWVSFSEYNNSLKKRSKKNLLWLFSIVKIATLSLLVLTLSNCWCEYFIPENSNKWLTTYKEAFSFRNSHYFISFLAEAGMIAFGFSSNKKYRFIITEPLEIEFPSSLSIVVRKWNQPMHVFLKKHVYQTWAKTGKFTAILATFLISSFLHGFELKVSVVLITIGIFSYLQVIPRNKVSELFDCCVKVYPCKLCNHKLKRNSLPVRLIMFCYTFGTIFHLAYLGALMDPSTDKIGIVEKWSQLYFGSHLIMTFNYFLSFL